jgi:hypothetical protein
MLRHVAEKRSECEAVKCTLVHFHIAYSRINNEAIESNFLQSVEFWRNCHKFCLHDISILLFIYGAEVEPGPLLKQPFIGLLYQALDGAIGGMNERQVKLDYSEETSLCAALSTTDPTFVDQGSNPVRRCGKSATNHLKYCKDLRKINVVYLKKQACQKTNMLIPITAPCTTFVTAKRLECCCVHQKRCDSESTS